MSDNDQMTASGTAKDRLNAVFEFEMRKYDRDREHELELNKFTHTFELERVKVLFLLNGGAFTLLVTLFDKQNGIGGIALNWMMAASAAWLFGLLCAAQAAQRALDTQRSFMQAYHRRRRAVEWRQFKKGGVDDETLKRIVGQPPPLYGAPQNSDKDPQNSDEDSQNSDENSQNSEEDLKCGQRHSLCNIIYERRKKFKPQHWVLMKNEDNGHCWPCNSINTFVKRIERWIVPGNWGPKPNEICDHRNFDESADNARKSGEKAADALKFWVRSSVVLFVVGGVCALVMVNFVQERGAPGPSS